MAEFCLECWNELNGTNDSEKEYICQRIWICVKDAENIKE